MLYNGYKDRSIKIEEEFRAAQATAYGIYLDMARVEEPLRLGEYSAFYALREMLEKTDERTGICSVFFEIQREKKIAALGLFEALRPNLGRIPPEIMDQYLITLHELDNINSMTSQPKFSQQRECERLPVGEVSGARHRFFSALHEIEKLAQALIKMYPDLSMVEQQRATKPTYIPSKGLAEEDQKIHDAALEELKTLK